MGVTDQSSGVKYLCPVSLVKAAKEECKINCTLKISAKAGIQVSWSYSGLPPEFTRGGFILSEAEGQE